MTWKLPINISISIQSARDTFGPSQMRNPSDGKCECWLLQQSPRQSVLRNIIHSTFGCIQQKAIWICGFFVYMYTFLSVLVHLFVRDCVFMVVKEKVPNSLPLLSGIVTSLHGLWFRGRFELGHDWCEPLSLNLNVSCGTSDRTMPKCEKQSEYHRVLVSAGF